MSNITSNTKSLKNRWLAVAGVGMVSLLAVTGCDRSGNKDDNTASSTDDNASVQEGTQASSTPASQPAIECDAPIVQERLTNVLQSHLSQQTQNLVNSYAQQAKVSVPNQAVSQKINTILIDIKNPKPVQSASENGMTTCQANVSLTLPSEDLYQSSQVYASAGQPSLQERLAEQNISLNNNMLVDDGFSFVVGDQSGELKASVVGQPAIINMVSDVLAGSMVQSALDSKREEIREERARIQQQQREQRLARLREREEKLKRQKIQPIQNPQPLSQSPSQEPMPTYEGSLPADGLTIHQSNNISSANSSSNQANQSNQPSQSSSAPSSSEFSVPTDDSIEMVIIEDPNATY